MLPLDAQVIGQNMTYVLVGVALVYFGYLFLAGGLPKMRRSAWRYSAFSLSLPQSSGRRLSGAHLAQPFCPRLYESHDRRL